ncbi:uncharacterized protein LOC144886385 isoform X2 [Branchiostoma floridae x Branchiostoma japonicum]
MSNFPKTLLISAYRNEDFGGAMLRFRVEVCQRQHLGQVWIATLELLRPTCCTCYLLLPDGRHQR